MVFNEMLEAQMLSSFPGRKSEKTWTKKQPFFCRMDMDLNGYDFFSRHFSPIRNNISRYQIYSIIYIQSVEEPLFGMCALGNYPGLHLLRALARFSKSTPVLSCSWHLDIKLNVEFACYFSSKSSEFIGPNRFSTIFMYNFCMTVSVGALVGIQFIQRAACVLAYRSSANRTSSKWPQANIGGKNGLLAL